MSWKKVIIVIFAIIILLNVFLIYVHNSQPASSSTTNDLNAVAWKPDDSYALIVGDHGTVLRYDGETFVEMDGPTTERLYDVAWAPDGRHALIVGGEGTILLFNNSQFVNIDSYTYDALSGVTWQNNTVAFIVGGSGTVFRLEEENLTLLPARTSNNLKDIEWYHRGGYGLIVGENGVVLKEYGTHFEELQSNTEAHLGKVSWRPFSVPYGEALIVGEDGSAIVYNDEGFFMHLSTGVSNLLTDVSWKNDGSSALIVGTQGLLLKFDGEDFSRESSATNGYIGGVDWKNFENTAIIVGGNGVVRKYPNLWLGPEMIGLIWIGEVFLGLGAATILIFNYFSNKRRKKALAQKKAETKVKGEVKIASAISYDNTDLFYKVKIENRTSSPISDITIKPYLSEEIFSLDKDKKNIPLVRSNSSKTVMFGIRPGRGQRGDADVLVRVNYYDPEIDGYKERLLKPKAIKIIWPVLNGKEIGEEEWEKITGSLLRAEETIPDIPLSGEKCTEFALNKVKDGEMHMLSPKVIEEGAYEARARYYALGDDGKKYCAELRIEAKEKNEPPSHLKIDFYAESRESLLGFYYIIFDKIDEGLQTIEKDVTMLRHMADFKSRIKDIQKEIAEQKTPLVSKVPGQAKGGVEPKQYLYEEFDRLRERIESIEKDKIGVDSEFKSLYELDELYKILADDLVKRKVVDIKIGEEQVKKKLDKRHIRELRRFKEAYDLLCEAETSRAILPREDFPDSAKKAILLVYFNAVEVYVREKLKELIPKGVTILLGEDRGHINTRKKDWEKSWSSLSLGSCIHIINNNRYIFLKNEGIWDEKVGTLMHQVRELRNTVAHPSKKNPDPRLVRKKVYALLSELPEVLKSKR